MYLRNQNDVHEHLLTKSEHIPTELGLPLNTPLLNMFASVRKLVNWDFCYSFIYGHFQETGIVEKRNEKH